MKLPPSTAKFVESAFGTNYAGYISLWNKQSGATSFYDSATFAALLSAIEDKADSCDLYLALGTQGNGLSGGRRGGADTVISLGGLVADVDFASAKQSKKKYVFDEKQAREILATFDFPYTALVHTGNGLHVHWHFDAPLILRAEEDRARAKKLVKGFQRKLQDHFRKHGAQIDSVGDLSRNYRIPGTFNHKEAPPKPVTLLQFEAAVRHSYPDIESFLEEPADSASTKRSAPKRPWPPADHDEIVKECAFYKSVVTDAAHVDEPSWYAGASITCRCADGEAIFHDYSSEHPGYDRSEAITKFTRALDEAGPRTCESIELDLGFSGCRSCPHRGFIKSPIQLGHSALRYEPGHEGPKPLGFTKEGLYALRDPIRNLIIQASANQLLAVQYLIGLAPSQFWARQFPAKHLFDGVRAGEALISLCRKAGPFNPARVRGRGIWLEGARIIINLGGPIPEAVKHLYLCFEPISLESQVSFPTARLFDLLKKFKWRDPNDATLFLGWLAIAPVCGVLSWRPHVFIYGPSKCGKTTIHTLTKQLLAL